MNNLWSSTKSFCKKWSKFIIPLSLFVLYCSRNRQFYPLGSAKLGPVFPTTTPVFTTTTCNAYNSVSVERPKCNAKIIKQSC